MPAAAVQAINDDPSGEGGDIGDSEMLDSAVSRLFEPATPVAPAAPATPAAPAVPATPPADPAQAKPADPQKKVDGFDDRPSNLSAQNFNVIKGERDAAKAELATIQKRLTEIEPLSAEAIALKKEREEIVKERDTLSERLRVLAIERHPRFEEYFGKGSERLVNMAKGIVGAEHADRLASVIAMTVGPERTARMDELFAELTPSQQSRVGGAINRYDELQTERSAEISKAKENYDRLSRTEQEDRQRAEQQSLQVFEAERNSAVQGLEVFKKREGTDPQAVAWNAEIDRRLESAKEIFSGSLSPADAAKAALWSVSAPLYRAMLSKQSEEMEKLRSQIQKLQGANPNPSPDGKDGKGGVKSESGFIDAFFQQA